MPDLIPNICDKCYATIMVGKPLGADHVALDLTNLRLVEEVKAMGQGRRTFALHTEMIVGPDGPYQAAWLTLRKPQDIKPGDSNVLIEHEHPLPIMNNNTNKQTTQDPVSPPREPEQIRDEVFSEGKVLRVLERSDAPLAAWEVAQRASITVSQAMERLKALSDTGAITRLKPSGDGSPVRWAARPDGGAGGAGSSIESGA